MSHHAASYSSCLGRGGGLAPAVLAARLCAGRAGCSLHSPLSSASSLSHLHWSPGWVCRAGLTHPKSACLSVNYPVKHSLTKITSIRFSYACYAKSLQSCPTLQPHGLQPARLLCPWDSPDKNTGAGCHALLQGIFPTQGSNAGLLHWRQTLHH